MSDFDVDLEGPALPELAKNRPGPLLEDYVRATGAAATREIENGVKNEVFNGQDRVQRAQNYADWRWRAYMAGEVDSL